MEESDGEQQKQDNILALNIFQIYSLKNLPQVRLLWSSQFHMCSKFLIGKNVIRSASLCLGIGKRTLCSERAFALGIE